VKEKPDILGTQGSEAGDIAKGTGRIAGWNGVERRKLQSKRWYDKISWKQLESRITDMVGLVFLQNQAEEIIGLSATSYSVSETGGSLTLTFTRVNPRTGLGLEFDVITEPVTAVRNVHYLSAEDGPPFSFAAGQTSLQRTVTILNANIGSGVSKTFRIRIAPPPSVGGYTRGPISEALVTINGAGAIGQNGVLQFSAQSYSIPETAGTDTVTVQVTRTGTMSPGAAQVTVTSSDGTATAPTHYAAVSQVLSWAAGDSSQKSVTFTPVNIGTQQGDRTCQLTLSAPTGAAITPTSSIPSGHSCT
jgi:hypothetical protein